MDKVSIIMPCYNCEMYLEEAINSVLNQSYENWELILIDDNSKDDTKRIISKYEKMDKRIVTLYQSVNSGAAQSRNIGVNRASGRYIAFLDSDDLWFPKKLEEQIAFMIQEKLSFSCTYYNKIDEKSIDLDRIIKYPEIADYKMLLKYCPGNSTVIYDSHKLGKFEVPNIRKRNDYLMWIEVIKKAKKLGCLNKVLGSHRVVVNSLSYDKKSLIKYHWEIYRVYENLSFFSSMFLVLFWIKKSILGSEY
ncbi:glycosyltransferase family 2 protein [Enterococcus casseliflavus]|nr:glycosyltransferase family 2 protein [Enterococcus casseliflavus]